MITITLDLQKAQRHDAILAFKQELKKMSHYNAAEGGSFNKEGGERLKCRKRLNVAAKKLINMGIDPDSIFNAGNYLVDAGCWQ
jgi:hypothetical protein